MINKVIDIINKQLSNWHAQGAFYGIAESIIRVSGSEITKMPGIVRSNGEITYVGIDDTHPIITYHKLNSITTTQLTNGTGDAFGDVVNAYNVGLFVYWDGGKINSNQDELLLMGQSKIPLAVTGLENIKNTVIRLVGANINSYQIYSQEYTFNEMTPLPENKRIIQINYNVQITFKPECFRAICPECS